MPYQQRANQYHHQEANNQQVPTQTTVKTNQVLKNFEK
jgi:hypothetical protein